MKKVIVKRLIYTFGDGKEHIGAAVYDNHFTDENILGAVHEIGKTQWIGKELWLLKRGCPICHITVAPFVQYKKTWFEELIEALKGE